MKLPHSVSRGFYVVLFVCGIAALWSWTTAQQVGAAPGSQPSGVDPVAVNGPIFEGWETPRVALVLTAELDGYLEPCGCAGLENQKGGLKRRHTFLNSMREKGWPVVAIDGGGLTKRVGVQAEIKYQVALEAMIAMGYEAIGVGANELRLSTSSLAFALGNLDQADTPVCSANVGILDFESGLTSRYRIIESGKMKIGVVSVLGAAEAQTLQSSELVTENPSIALQKVAPEFTAANCDVQILLVYGSPTEARHLASQFQQFDMVLATGGAEEPPLRPSEIPGSRAMLIEAGHKGMYAIVIGLYDDKDAPLRYQRVPLDARFEDSPKIAQIMADYQNELELRSLSGLGLIGTAHPEGKFVGSSVCADCHTSAAEKFSETTHSHALDTLVKLDPPRHFDPECLSCHVTGWNPQQYFPYESGYLGLDSTPELQHNGCENCHGPGAAHVAAETGTVDVTDAEQEQLRAGMRLKIVDNEGNKDGEVLGTVVNKCLECHDLDNSPEFDFKKYWPEVAHEGKD
ncbi:MAG: hypothetical protein KDA61_11530 [Planctomycetales bacterium]|nr:hypothetical protein [Planctomycetales bacterium]